jgi:hypothetical protein
LSSTPDSALRPISNTETEAADIDDGMSWSSGLRIVVGDQAQDTTAN